MELPCLFHHTEDVSQSSEGMKTRFKDLDVNRVGGQKFDAEAKKKEKERERKLFQEEKCHISIQSHCQTQYPEVATQV